MNKDYLLEHLKEAKKELDRNIENLESIEDYGVTEYVTSMSHLYQHLNTAWNAQSVSIDAELEACEETLRQWRNFPSEEELLSMEYQDIYRLSLEFGPPKIDLSQAEVIDGHGEGRLSELKVDHQKPNDVKRNELNYYGWVYPFIKATDLIFYLYPLLVEFKNDKNMDCIDSFMYSLNREIGGLSKSLSSDELNLIKKALQIIWGLGGKDYVDWGSCRNLQKLIGITID